MMNCYSQNAILPTIFSLKKIEISGFISAFALIERCIALKFVYSFLFIILYLLCRESIFAGRAIYLQLRRAFVRLKLVLTLAYPNFSLLSRRMPPCVPQVPEVSPRFSAYIRKLPKVNPPSSARIRRVPKVITRASVRVRELLKVCHPLSAEKREEILLTKPLIT